MVLIPIKLGYALPLWNDRFIYDSISFLHFQHKVVGRKSYFLLDSTLGMCVLPLNYEVAGLSHGPNQRKEKNFFL